MSERYRSSSRRLLATRTTATTMQDEQHNGPDGDKDEIHFAFRQPMATSMTTAAITLATLMTITGMSSQ